MTDPRLVSKRIDINSIIEINNERLAITGRTGQQILYKHAYQFAVDDQHAKYIKEIGKYIDRCKAADRLFAEGELVNREDNIKLYDWFIQRLHSNVYYSLSPLQNVCKDIEQYRQEFCNMDVLQQSLLLVQILYAFKCNSVWSNFKTLNGKGQVGILKFSKTISNNNSAVLVHQSVTGLYEVYEDLLK